MYKGIDLSNCATTLTVPSNYCCTTEGPATISLADNIAKFTGLTFEDAIAVWKKGAVDKVVEEMKKKKKINMLLPRVVSVETYNDRVVMVRFEDGSWTKAVTSENDVFDLDVGITVCIIKKMLGGQKEGTKLYSKYLKSIHKTIDENNKKKAEEKEKEERTREKQHKIAMKRKAKQLKMKEEQIDIVKQGVERAIQERDMA